MQAAFPLGPEGDVPCTLQDHLKLVPDRMKSQQKEVVKTKAVHVLAMAKSHYPQVDLQQFREGFTVDVDEEKFEALLLEVTPTTELLLDDIDL